MPAQGSKVEGSNYFDVVRRVLLLSPKKKKIFILCIEIFLIVVLMNLLAGLLWEVFESSEPSTNPVPFSVVKSGSTNGTNSKRYSALDGFAPFGKAVTQSGQSKSKQKNIAAIPRSRLPVRVTGLLSHTDPAVALAIIEARGKQQSYRIGDIINNSRAEIVSIYPDRVIVDDKGKQQALMLYPDQETSTVVDVKPIAEPDILEKIDRAALIADPMKLTELISISPVRREGQLKGYRVNPKKNPQLFLQAGLKRNDLVIAINGVDLTDVVGAMEVFNNLDAFERIDLTVEREGMLHQVELSL